MDSVQLDLPDQGRCRCCKVVINFDACQLAFGTFRRPSSTRSQKDGPRANGAGRLDIIE